MDQSWFQWVNELLPARKAGNLVEIIWNFDCPAASELFKTAIDALGLSGLTMYQTRRSGAGIVRGKNCENEFGGTTLSLARSTSWKQSRNMLRDC